MMLLKPRRHALTILFLVSVFVLAVVDRASAVPPTIAAITNQTVYVDHPALFRLNVNDAETLEKDLKLSLVSSDPVLFPPTNVVFHDFLFDPSPDTENWYITITPAFGLTGTATNTVWVSDGTSSNSTSFVLTVIPPPPGAARFANTNAMTIPDVGTASLYPSTINVAGMSGTITNMTLTVSKFSHTYPGDIHMLLVSPTGQGVVIWSHCGAQYSVNKMTATLNDAATFPLPGPFEIWSEVFKPTNLGTTNFFPAPAPGGPYGTNFAALNGLAANGTWSLYVDDPEGPDNGSIAGGWSLMVATTGGHSDTTISDILNQSTTVGVATAAIPFTIGDPNIPAATLTLSGASSNTTLLPNSNIAFGGSGSNRTVTVTPAAGQTGTATITVNVNGGTSAASTTFALTVSTVNTPPTITGIADRTIDEDTNTGAIAFTIGDAEAAAGNLNLSKSSSNPTLVPTNNIVFGGSGASRTVTVTPAANQNGTATITVTVSDGQMSTNESFLLTVNAVNDVPAISNIPDQATAVNTPTAAIPFTIGDVETPAASLTLGKDSSNPTLVPINNIVFGGSASNRTVTVTPAAGQSGNATITVTVSDGTNTSSDTFVLSVGPANVPPFILPIADQTTLIERAVGPFNIVIGDAETPIGNLTLSGTSSDTSLVPNGNIVLYNNGVQTLTVSPAPGRTGTTTITVTVSDGTNNTSTAFLLSVSPPGPNTAVFDNANPLTIPFHAVAASYPSMNHVSGMPGGITKLTLTLKDINHSAGHDLEMLLVGPGGHQSVLFAHVGGGALSSTTVTLDDAATYPLPPSPYGVLPGTYKPAEFSHDPFPAPAPGGSYATTLSDFNGLSPNADWLLYVFNDPTGTGSGTISRGWSLAVTTDAPHSPPTITGVSNRSTYVNTPTAAIPFTIADADTLLANLVLTAGSSNPALVPASNIVFGGSGANRTVTVTPASNLGGSATITLTVTDDTGGSASTNFVLTVTKAPASVTLVGTNQAYSGTPRVVTATTVPPGLTVDITYNGSPNAPTNPGTYLVIGTVNDVAFSGSTTNQLTVTQKVLTITGITASNKVYDGGTNATLSGTPQLVGVVGNDAVSVASVMYDNSVNPLPWLLNPGTSEIGDEITMAGPVNSVSTFSFEIWGAGNGARGLPQSDVQVVLRFYKNAGATPAAVTGFSAPCPTPLLYQSLPFTIPASAWQGAFSNRITLIYDRTYGDFDVLASTPLTAALPSSFTWTVQFSAITGADNFSLRLYDPPVIGGSYRDYWLREGTGTNDWGLYTFDNPPIVSFGARLEAVPTGSFADKNAGTNKIVTISGLSLNGADADNYTLPQPTTTANIAAKGLTVTGITAGNKVYDGTVAAALNTAGAVLNGVLAGDGATLNTTGATGIFNNANVGTAKTVNVAGLTLLGVDKDNYAVTPPTTQANITPASLTVTAQNLNKVYGSAAGYTGTEFTRQGPLFGSDTLTIVTLASDGAPASALVGPYPLVPSAAQGVGLGNYLIGYSNGTLTVTVRPLSVVANDATRVYGEPNPVFTGTITGVQNGDNITASYTNATTTASMPGTYAIVPVLNDPSGKLVNYSVGLVNGVLTIVDVPRLLSVVESPAGTFTLQWQVYAGRTYRFEYKNHLLEASWTGFGTTNTATSSIVTNVDNAGVNLRRFYRALDTPAP